MELRYGINPGQLARASAIDESAPPIRLLRGRPSYVNLLDALNAWQLVREAASALGLPVATSFKHVSPAGAAAAGHIDDVMEETWAVESGTLSPVAMAYIRARDCDPKSSFGDFVAVSEPVDLPLARVLASVISDGVIAPGFEPGVMDVLARKKGGSYVVIEADGSFQPPASETREVFGLKLSQQRAVTPVTREVIRAGAAMVLPESAVTDLVLASITARYTQSNTVTYAKSGMVLSVGAGQQSRVDCTKLAGSKVDTWWLRRQEAVRSLHFRSSARRQDRINWQIRYLEGDLTADERRRMQEVIGEVPEPMSVETRSQWLQQLTDVALASDGFLPFRDNIDQAARHGVRYIAHPGGSARADEVEEACNEHDIRLVNTGIRLFHH
ncbi:MAG TPA: phosphoribosylaminoimidazolecarboxamide formyltransferase [Streptosporangiaceae bacterium]|nr:phosphoribosylaminoimidazolecarboxamide formyltransferase [Streptosporangiaceae bacterium]